MAKILGLDGVEKQGDPNLDIILDLEELLERAKAGEIQGMAYCIVKYSGSGETGWCGAAGSREKICSGITLLRHRYTKRLLEE